MLTLMLCHATRRCPAVRAIASRARRFTSTRAAERKESLMRRCYIITCAPVPSMLAPRYAEFMRPRADRRHARRAVTLRVARSHAYDAAMIRATICHERFDERVQQRLLMPRLMMTARHYVTESLRYMPYYAMSVMIVCAEISP